jgi:hypothetical protein
MKSDPTFNRRRYPRVRSEALISIAPLDIDAALAHAIDLSIDGVRFRCVGMDAKEGELLKVTFTFGERTLGVIGRILRAEWIDGVAQEVAIRFLKMSEETRRVLIESLEPFAEMTSSSASRRAFTRVHVDSIVGVSRANLSDVVAQAQDVSDGGIHFVVEGLDLKLGDVLRVTFECDGAPVSAIGQLVRVTDIGDSKQEAALAFLDGDRDVLGRIRSASED